jgi:hypothetical protein
MHGREPNLQIVAHHHFEHEKQLPVRDESVAIHVVDLERNLDDDTSGGFFSVE